MAYYSIYFDETGDFQGSGNGDFYAICGFVWQGSANQLNSSLKTFCTELSDWLRSEGQNGGKSFPECLHTTENNNLKTLLSDHNLDTDILHSRLENLPLFITGIYAFKDEVHREDYTLDDLYQKMIRSLMRKISVKIREKDSEADITFHIPTRVTVFEIDEEKKKQEYQKNDIIVSRRIDSQAGSINLNVSLNTPEAFRDISRELNVHCSVREISYKITNPDNDDYSFHQKRNTESTLWGYYTADIINYWIRSIARDSGKGPGMLEAEMKSLLKVFLILPFSKNIEAAQQARNNIHESPCAYLETLEKLHAVHNSSKRTEYAIRIMEEPNPFSETAMIREAGRQIKELYIFESKYAQAQILLERLKSLCEQAGNVNNPEYCDIIAALMTCYHHEGGNARAQALFEMVKNTLINNPARAMDICNKYQEFYVNTLAFEQGVRFVQDVLDNFKPATSSKSIGGISISGASISVEETAILAKTKSSLGAFHAYLNHKETAETLFLESIDLFNSIGQTGNASITRSHYIHMLLDTEDIHSEKLLKQLNQYFCSEINGPAPNPDFAETWEKWLTDSFHLSTDEKGIFNPYAASFYFWIWLKAINKMPENILKASKDFFNILSKYPDHLKITALRKHPAEMIRKYHAILFARLGDQRSARKGIKILDEFIHLYDDYGTIPLLCRVAKHDIKLILAELTEEEIRILEAETARDIEKLHNEFHQGTVDQMPVTLIDRLHQKKPLKMGDLEEVLTYEFR